MTAEQIKLLRAPYHPKDVLWKPLKCGESAKGRKWAMVLAYVDARVGQQRLDDVGVLWQTNYRDIPGGVICELSIWHEGVGWVTRSDGAQWGGEDDQDPIKTGVSNAFKRALFKWGPGVYFYGFGTTLVDVVPSPDDWKAPWWKQIDSKGYSKQTGNKTEIKGWWRYPMLPEQFIPSGYEYPWETA